MAAETENDQDLSEEIFLPATELDHYKALIKKYRQQHIRDASSLVDEVFSETDYSKRIARNKDVSQVIAEVREAAWQKFLVEEAKFNKILIGDLHKTLDIPQTLLANLVQRLTPQLSGEPLKAAVKDICGEYAGSIYTYAYVLSLSNTNSRRSRAGRTFEEVIYKLYKLLGYPFDSQSKVGRAVFEKAGLGKKVDSVLPSVEAFLQRRNKTIIGTMKTSLRERWQEVAEEITRTNIPEIHLLTVDREISRNKAKEMSAHNIVIVASKEVAESDALSAMKNIISFEEYFYEEIPKYLEYWK